MLGAARVLTSAGAPTALEGAAALRELVTQSNGRIAILAGGGVREENVTQLIRSSGVHEVHTKLKERSEEEIDEARMRHFVANVRNA